MTHRKGCALSDNTAGDDTASVVMSVVELLRYAGPSFLLCLYRDECVAAAVVCWCDNLFRRVDEHRAGSAGAYTTQYKLFRLVYCERYNFVDHAIMREKQLKGWTRKKKLDLARCANPQLYDMRDFSVVTFGDGFVARVPEKKLKMVFDAEKRMSFGEGEGGPAAH